MKFRVFGALKARGLRDVVLDGIIAPGIYDAGDANFPAELKDILLAEAKEGRGLVEIVPGSIIEKVVEKVKPKKSKEPEEPKEPEENENEGQDDGEGQEPETQNESETDEDPVEDEPIVTEQPKPKKAIRKKRVIK